MSLNMPFGQRKTSPATNTFAGPALRFASHTMPSSMVRPLSLHHCVAGATPIPTMTTSASIVSPFVKVTPVTFASPLIDATCTPQRIATPLRSCTAPIAAPISGPSARISGASKPSSTVTFAPRLVAVAAASKPMNPAPITTTRAPSTSSSRNAAASSSVRNT